MPEPVLVQRRGKWEAKLKLSSTRTLYVGKFRNSWDAEAALAASLAKLGVNSGTVTVAVDPSGPGGASTGGEASGSSVGFAAGSGTGSSAGVGPGVGGGRGSGGGAATKSLDPGGQSQQVAGLPVAFRLSALARRSAAACAASATG